jgi:hypothetical protein
MRYTVKKRKAPISPGVGLYFIKLYCPVSEYPFTGNWGNKIDDWCLENHPGMFVDGPFIEPVASYTTEKRKYYLHVFCHTEEDVALFLLKWGGA